MPEVNNMRLRISSYTFLKSNSIIKKPNKNLKTSGRKTISFFKGCT